MPVANLDIGTFSKRTILTGAGWTRNWGGRLANEVWQDLMSNAAVRENARIRDLLLRDPSFESVLGFLQSEDPGDSQVFEHALLDAFTAMDAEVARPGRQPWINIYKVQDLIFRFWGQRGDHVNAGYMFTLNQDLWPERNLYNEHAIGAAPANLPGLQRRPNQRLFTTDLGRYGEAFVMQVPSDVAAAPPLRGAFNVIKLHGSFNWRTADGRNAMVVGTEKTAQIAVFPLLRLYWEVFRRVLTAGDVRLLVVGYGFGDEHVNEAIADAVEHHGLKVLVWDTAHDLMERVRKAPRGAVIWEGLLSTATRPLIEVFPGDQAETAEYRRILSTMVL